MHGDGRRRPWGGALARVEARRVLAACRTGRDLVAEFPEWFEDLLPPVPLGTVVTHVGRHAAAPAPEEVHVLGIDGARVLVRTAADPLGRRRWVWRRDLVLADTPLLAAARSARAEDLLAAATVAAANGAPVDLPAGRHAPVTATVDLRDAPAIITAEVGPRPVVRTTPGRPTGHRPTTARDRLVTSGG